MVRRFSTDHGYSNEISYLKTLEVSSSQKITMTSPDAFQVHASIKQVLPHGAQSSSHFSL